MKHTRINHRQFDELGGPGAGSLTSRGVVLASVAVTAVALTACSAWPPAPPLRSTASTASTASTPATSSAATDVTQRVDIGGRSLYLECRGAGSPTVILEAGLRNHGGVWSVPASPTSTETMVFPGVAAFTRACAYDRPGTTLGVDDRSRSDPVPMPRTVRNAVDDLHALLTKANIAGPYILVGHSTGGMIARLYATTYPDEVAGMVWVDALPDDMRAHMTPAQYSTFVGLNEDVPEAVADYTDFETILFDPSFDQMREAATTTPLRPMPLVVLSRSVPTEGFPSSVPAEFGPAFERAWQAEQKRLVTLVPNAQQVIATESGHYIMLEQPNLVIDAIRGVVNQVRNR